VSFTGASFIAAAHDWLRQACREAGITISAPIVQIHVRSWSTVFRAPTAGGAVYLKCCGPTQRHEPGLTALLDREFPGVVPEVIALHPDQPWMLVAEGGTKLRDAFSGDGLLRAWRDILPRYARVQRALTERTPDLLALGTPDRRAEPLVTGFAELLAGEPELSGGRADRLTSDERSALTSLGPMLGEQLRELAALGVSDTLQHDDLHDANVLVRDGRTVIFDWGDACVSHPFFTLATTLRFAAEHTGRPEDAPEILALRDAYLEPWSDRGSPAELTNAADLARRIGQVPRVLTFGVIARAYPGEVDAYPGGLAGLLRRVLAQLQAETGRTPR
jgi:hypothetical protein